MFLLLLITLGTHQFDLDEVDYLLDDNNQFMMETLLEEYGKNIIINDVCKIGDTYYLAGGATRLLPSYGGMDAVLFTYKDHAVHLLNTYGGRNDDYFTGIVCDKSLFLIGTSRSKDFISTSSLFQSGFYLETDDQGNVIMLERIPYNFDVFLEDVTILEDSIFFAGYVDTVSGKDALVGKVDNELVEVNVYTYSGDDKLFGIGVSEEGLIAVGQTDSVELGAYAKRAFSLTFDQELNLLSTTVDETSLTSTYEFYEDGLMGGSLGTNGYLHYPDGTKIVDDQVNTYYSSSMASKGNYPVIDERTLKTEGLPVFYDEQLSIIQKTDPIHSILILEQYTVDLDSGTINGEVGEFINRTGEITEPGVYEQIYTLVTDEVEVYYAKEELSVSAYTNITESTYFEPVRVLHFGTAVLDGVEIFTGTEVFEPGSHILNLNGEEISFKIKTKPTYVVVPLPMETSFQLHAPVNDSKWWLLLAVVLTNYIYRKWNGI